MLLFSSSVTAATLKMSFSKVLGSDKSECCTNEYDVSYNFNHTMITPIHTHYISPSIYCKPRKNSVRYI